MVTGVNPQTGVRLRVAVGVAVKIGVEVEVRVGVGVVIPDGLTGRRLQAQAIKPITRNKDAIKSFFIHRSDLILDHYTTLSNQPG